MNKREYIILNELINSHYTNQRELAKITGYSLGTVNNTLKTLIEERYIDEEYNVLSKVYSEMEEKKPKNAIILAAGFGMRMIPINSETPKALLNVRGEVLIERIINQLHDVGVNDIYIVVGFMKEKFEYLIDDFGVNLIYNSEYSSKNNMYSLKLLLDKIQNTYIIPSDIWSNDNPFNKYELFSWYSITDRMTKSSDVKLNRKEELVTVDYNEFGNEMIGISYLLKKEGQLLKNQIMQMTLDRRYDNAFWEDALYKNGKMIVESKVFDSTKIVEINTFEQLREFDKRSDNLNSEVLTLIATELKVDKNEIKNIASLKKGMTNRSFTFDCKGKKYIMRIPGEGTDMLINRKNEADVYRAIQKENICDNVIYINENNGYKITEFLIDSRNCNANCDEDVKRCMKILKRFHEKNIQVNHKFDLYEQIDFYEFLWKSSESIFKDYNETKKNILSLRNFVESNVEKRCLTHIDSVADNFMFVGNDIKLIDWEYAGMQDPHVDIAMFGIYSLYSKSQIDNLIDIYFENQCKDNIRIKIYCYVAICGLLWSNWCEYKRQLGVEFGEYSIAQYRYAKEYYRYAVEGMEKLKWDI